MSLLMEALKKAEQSKQQTSTPPEVANHTLPQNIASVEQVKQPEVESNDTVLPTVLAEEKLEQFEPVESLETQDIIEPIEIEDPNSVFNHLDELDWHFELENEPEPVIKETKAIPILDSSLALELIEPLAEQAKIGAETQDIPDLNDILLDDLEIEQNTIIDNIEPEEIKPLEVVQTTSIVADDGLEWDAGIFAPDEAESSNQYAAKYKEYTEEKSATAFRTKSTFIDDAEFQLDETTPKVEKLLTKPELKSDIVRPDPLTAKRVLLATAHHGNGRRSALFSVLLLVLFLGVGFAGYYVYQMTSSMIQFPQFADFNSEQMRPNATPKSMIMPESTQLPITQTVLEANLNTEIEPKRQTFVEKAKSLLSEVMPEIQTKIGLTTKEVIQYKPTVSEEIEIIKPVKRTTTITRAQKPLITKSIIDSLDADKPRPLPQQKGSKDIKIKKVSRNTSFLHQQLKQAYQAFQKGQNKQAKRLYQQVLNKSNKNRDALLGLAAIAQRNQQVQAAEYYYQQILKYYPNDSMAQMGLSAVQQKSPASSESQIKILLDQSPESAYLHFSLGNVYAQQKRWRKAQQAYFDAYRFDEQKADYAYNLAVSLEYLHQSKAALPFYQKALQLSQKQATQFNAEQVKKRIQQLTP